MDATGTELKEHMPPARDGAMLVSLPLDVLELVCSSLTLEDRVALTSCCQRLWTRPDVTNSTRLWGVIDAEFLRYENTYAQLLGSMGHWLARRKAAVGRLSVQGYLGGIDPAEMLAGLEDGALSALEIHGMDVIGANLAEALAPLAHLSGLTELSLQYCDVRRLPPQLSALPALKVLDIANHREPGDAQAVAIGPLAALTQLTALRVQGFELRQLPRQLSVLAASLQSLDLTVSNEGLGDWVAGSVHPLGSLSALTSLTSLNMKSCGLPCVPPQLSAMGSLQCLQLSSDDMCGARPECWDPLRRITRLTFLDLGYCYLAYLPQQLSCLTVLAELLLSWNEDVGPSLEEGGPASAQGQPAGAEASSWQPLLSLGASLTSLDMRVCSIAALPAGLSSLSALVKLDLSCNARLGVAADSAFQPLSGLVSLRVLKLNMMELKCIPPQLKVLPALEELWLRGNGLGYKSKIGQQLLELPALKRLHFGCNVGISRSNARGLWALRARGVSVS